MEQETERGVSARIVGNAGYGLLKATVFAGDALTDTQRRRTGKNLGTMEPSTVMHSRRKMRVEPA